MAVPVPVFVTSPDPDIDAVVIFELARFRVPVLMFSNLEIVVLALKETPAALSIVRSLAAVRPFPVTCAAVPL